MGEYCTSGEEVILWIPRPAFFLISKRNESFRPFPLAGFRARFFPCFRNETKTHFPKRRRRKKIGTNKRTNKCVVATQRSQPQWTLALSTDPRGEHCQRVSLWVTWAVQGRKIEYKSTPFPGSTATNRNWTMPGLGCLSTTSLNVISVGSRTLNQRRSAVRVKGMVCGCFTKRDGELWCWHTRATRASIARDPLG